MFLFPSTTSEYQLHISTLILNRSVQWNVGILPSVVTVTGPWYELEPSSLNDINDISYVLSAFKPTIRNVSGILGNSHSVLVIIIDWKNIKWICMRKKAQLDWALLWYETYM